MNLTRRLLLKIFAVFSLSSGLNIRAAVATNQLNPEELAVIIIYVDHLIPETESPGAISVGTEKFIVEKANNSPLYAEGLKKGIAWLNLLANKFNHKSFSVLPPEIQLKIMSYAENQPIATLPHLLHHTLKDDVFNYYYSHPAIISLFRYAGPPQPIGFPDYNQLPHTVIR